jgi:hypothetical protein
VQYNELLAGLMVIDALSKDYEISIATAENFAYIAHAMLLLNRFSTS